MAGQEKNRAIGLIAILMLSNILIIVTILLILGAYLAAQLGIHLGETMQFLAIVDLAFGLRFLTPVLSLICILIVGFFLPGELKGIKTFTNITAALGIISSLTWWVVLYYLHIRG